MWDYLLHRIFGIGEEGSAQVRLGAGVVHLTTTAFVAFCAGVAAVSWALSKEPNFVLGIAAIMSVVVLIFLIGTWRFADKHPDQAVLGGSSWLKLRQLEIEAKGQPRMVVLPSTTDPQQPTPQNSSSLLNSPDDE